MYATLLSMTRRTQRAAQYKQRQQYVAVSCRLAKPMKRLIWRLAKQAKCTPSALMAELLQVALNRRMT
jgi:predicted KAP-like P-loop ATPase